MTAGYKPLNFRSRCLLFDFNGGCVAHMFNRGLAPLTPKRKIRATSTNTTRSRNAQLFFRGQGRQPLGVGCVGLEEDLMNGNYRTNQQI